MTKFILHISGFCIAVFIVLSALKATLPYYWGNEEICEKMSLIEGDTSGYELIYLGPSAVKREFIPSEFEQSLRDTTLRSFNLGGGAMYYGEQVYLAKHLIKSKLAETVRYLFLFGQEPKIIKDKDFHTLRIKYYFDWETYYTGVRFHYLNGALDQVYKYTITFFENQLFIGEVFDMVGWHFKTFKFSEEIASLAGYVPYDYSVKIGMNGADRHDRFLAKNEDKQFKKGSKRKSKESNKQKKLEPHQDLVLKRLLDLQSQASEKNITIVQVFKPNFSDYLGAQKLNKIYFGNGQDYPEYFEINYRYDNAHLNETGAIMHSERLAQLFESAFISIPQADTVTTEGTKPVKKKTAKKKSKKNKKGNPTDKQKKKNKKKGKKKTPKKAP